MELISKVKLKKIEKQDSLHKKSLYLNNKQTTAAMNDLKEAIKMRRMQLTQYDDSDKSNDEEDDWSD
jgi:hypothetical protein